MPKLAQKAKALSGKGSVVSYAHEPTKFYFRELIAGTKNYQSQLIKDAETLDEALDLRENEKTSSCSMCGTFRRRAMDYAAKDIGADLIATGHNLDDTLQTFVINMLSGDTTKVGWMNPDTSTNSLRKIKPFCEIYESEIVFYTFTNNLPFQSEPCPHMNEGIRTDIREFLNSLENQRSGIKNNLYQSIIKVSDVMKNSNSNTKQKTNCEKCGAECTGNICSVCNMVLKLKSNQT